MLGEDTGVFFREFAVEAVFRKSGGGLPDQACVIYDAEGAEVLDGDVISLSPSITCQAAVWPDAEDGDLVRVNHTDHRIQTVTLLDDGALKRITLARV